MTRRLVSSVLFISAFVMSCASNPNAPSPVKKEPAAASEGRDPNAILVLNLEGGQVGASARRPVARSWLYARVVAI